MSIKPLLSYLYTRRHAIARVIALVLVVLAIAWDWAFGIPSLLLALYSLGDLNKL